MIPLKKPNLRRCFNFAATATYDKYFSFLKNFAPCIPVFLSRIMFQAFLQCNQLYNSLNHYKRSEAFFIYQFILFSKKRVLSN